jgi:hypothetical protein
VIRWKKNAGAAYQDLQGRGSALEQEVAGLVAGWEIGECFPLPADRFFRESGVNTYVRNLRTQRGWVVVWACEDGDVWVELLGEFNI